MCVPLRCCTFNCFLLACFSLLFFSRSILVHCLSIVSLVRFDVSNLRMKLMATKKEAFTVFGTMSLSIRSITFLLSNSVLRTAFFFLNELNGKEKAAKLIKLQWCFKENEQKQQQQLLRVTTKIETHTRNRMKLYERFDFFCCCLYAVTERTNEMKKKSWMESNIVRWASFSFL